MTSEFIHDPEGILLFEEPTDVEVSSGGATSTATVRVLPYSTRRDEDTFWAGPDTYRVPEGAEYTTLKELNIAEIDADVTTEHGMGVSLARLLSDK